jgi:hypothetical protein
LHKCPGASATAPQFLQEYAIATAPFLALFHRPAATAPPDVNAALFGAAGNGTDNHRKNAIARTILLERNGIMA